MYFTRTGLWIYDAFALYIWGRKKKTEQHVSACLDFTFSIPCMFVNANEWIQSMLCVSSWLEFDWVNLIQVNKRSACSLKLYYLLYTIPTRKETHNSHSHNVSCNLEVQSLSLLLWTLYGFENRRQFFTTSNRKLDIYTICTCSLVLYWEKDLSKPMQMPRFQIRHPSVNEMVSLNRSGTEYSSFSTASCKYWA